MNSLRLKWPSGAALALAACAALAQTAPAAPSAPEQAPAARARDDAHAAMRQRMAARHAEYLERLKKELNLSAEQEGAWARYRAAMQPAEAGPEPRRHEELAGLSTPERIDRMNDWMAQRQAQMRQRGEAIKAFYASLNEQQKQIFDRAAPPRRHGPHAG